jgi:hypothetical protein
MSSEDNFVVEKKPVLARDQSPSRLFGFTWGDIGTLMAALLVPLWLTGNNYAALISVSASYLFVKKIKRSLPDRIVSNMARWYLVRKEFLYRAGARDTEWRPPLRR